MSDANVSASEAALCDYNRQNDYVRRKLKHGHFRKFILIQISLVTCLEVLNKSNEVLHRGLEQVSKIQDK